MTQPVQHEQDLENSPVARPRVDVLETEHEMVLVADLPGVKPDDVDVRFENGELTIHGRRNPNRNERRWVYREFEPAHPHRTFRLTEDVAADRIHAELKNGLLTVHLPKAETAKPRKIAVKGD